MKRLFVSVIMLTAFAGMSACGGDDSQEQDLFLDSPQMEESTGTEIPAITSVTFTGSVQEGTSKVAIANGGYVFSASESISVFAGNNTGRMYKFESNCNPNVTSADFTGDMDLEDSKSSIFYAVLPFRDNYSCQDGKINLTLPNIQNAVANTVNPSSCIMVSTTSSREGAYKFKPICSYLKLEVVEDMGPITITGGNGEILAGDLSVDPSTGAATVINGNTSIILNPAGPSKKVLKGTYYVSMLPVIFKNKIIIKSEGTVIKEIEVSDLSIARSHCRTITGIKIHENPEEEFGLHVPDFPDGEDVTITIPGSNVKIEMVYVKGGFFWMENHWVIVSPYYIGKYELTQEQYYAVLHENPSEFRGDRLPVENVSWDGANRYIDALNELTGRNFHLPTEAQWEFAAKESGYDEVLDDYAWYSENSEGHTHEVGGKKPNKYGIYDMLGNVWEWCYDWYGGYPSEAQIDPSGPDGGSFRVLRGGGWSDGAGSASSSARNCYYPNRGGISYGFRLALFL